MNREKTIDFISDFIEQALEKHISVDSVEVGDIICQNEFYTLTILEFDNEKGTHVVDVLVKLPAPVDFINVDLKI